MSDFEISEKKDSNGDSFKIGRGTLKNGEKVQILPDMERIPQNIEGMKTINVREDDVWLLTYPKSGTHWTYEIIKMLQRKSAEPVEHYKSVKLMIAYIRDWTAVSTMTEPRVFNTHLRPKYIPECVLNKSKIVHVVRNPKSVAVSYYHHLFNASPLEYSGTFRGFLPTYVEGVEDVYGNWFDYIKEWGSACKGKENVHFIFYENMIKNPEEEVRRLAAFLNIEVTDKLVSDIISNTSFDVMKTGKGKTAPENERILGYWKDNKSHNEAIMRKGTSTDWRNYFTEEDNRWFDSVYDREMAECSDLKELISFE